MVALIIFFTGLLRPLSSLHHQIVIVPASTKHTANGSNTATIIIITQRTASSNKLLSASPYINSAIYFTVLLLLQTVYTFFQI